MNQLQSQGRAKPASSAVLRGGFSLFCLLCAVLFSVNVRAADADAGKGLAPIAIQLKQFKVIKDELGEQKLIDAALVLPGDVIEYRATYLNRSSVTLPVIATMPIPVSMEYVKESAKAKNNLAHTVALKDSQFANEPLVQKVVTASGATLSQPAPYASYRFVRWDLGKLPAGNSVEVSVRAKVSQDLEKDANAAEKTSVQVSSSVNK